MHPRVVGRAKPHKVISLPREVEALDTSGPAGGGGVTGLANDAGLNAAMIAPNRLTTGSL